LDVERARRGPPPPAPLRPQGLPAAVRERGAQGAARQPLQHPAVPADRRGPPRQERGRQVPRRRHHAPARPPPRPETGVRPPAAPPPAVARLAPPDRAKAAMTPPAATRVLMRQGGTFLIVGLMATAVHAAASLAAREFGHLDAIAATTTGYLCAVGVSYLGN